MNEQLIKFIELCLTDGVITDKEREVIFRKSKELGVPEDECEIILESMTFKKNDNKKDSNNREESIDETSQNEIKVNNEKDSKNNTNDITKSKTTEDIQHTHPSNEHTNIKRNDKNKESGKVDFSNFISVHSSKKGVFGRRFILDLEKTFKSINNKWYVEDKVREVIEPLKDKVIFKFSHSFVVGEDFLISVESGKKIPLLKVNDFELKDGKTFSKSGFFLDNEWFGDFFSMDNEGGKELFYLFKKYINENLENDKSKNENNNQESDNEKISKKDDGKVLEKDLTFDDKINVELEKQEEEISKVFLKDFLNSISYKNITNPKSKLFELLSNEQFSCSYTLYKDQIKIKGGISDTKQLEDSILGLKYIVIDRLFRPFFTLLKGDHTIFNVHLYSNHHEWFRTYETRTHHDRPRPGFPNGVPIPYKGYVRLSKDNWGIYLDKNGWFFNPFRDEIMFFFGYYLDVTGNKKSTRPNTDTYDLDPFRDNPPNFIKGSLFKKPVFVLKDGTKVEIKSNKLFEESEKYYNYWYKFLKTIEQFKKELISNKSSTYKLELENSYEKWIQLVTHFDEVNNILKSKESEIQSKEKEFQTNFIQDFIRTLNFIDENIKNSKRLNLTFQGRIERKKYESTEFIEQLNKLIESENIFITTNSTILFGLVDMIRSIIYDDRVRFYQIYEKFDKMRIFNSQHQNDVLNSLNSINDNLFELNSNIETLTNTIDNLGKELIYSIRELKFEVSYLNDTVSSQLQNISTKLDVNNLLNVVQTYQLWRINSNTKSINRKLNF